MKMKLSTCLALLISTVFCSRGYAEDQKPTEGINQQWLKAIVSIEVSNSNRTSAIGTGFLVQSPSNHIILVTASHVVQNANAGELAYRMNKKDGGSHLVKESELSEVISGGWIHSKSNDVACRFIFIPKEGDLRLIPYSFFLRKEFVRAGAPVVVGGFPMGLRSEKFATPIIRRGIVALSDNDHFMIDASIFPGNSGGPVIYAPSLKINGNGGIQISSPFLAEDKILGLVSSVIPYIDTAVSPQTGRTRITFEEFSGLCNIVPSDAILDLLDNGEVKAADSR